MDPNIVYSNFLKDLTETFPSIFCEVLKTTMLGSHAASLTPE